MTAISAPVGTAFSSFWSSSRSGRPDGVDVLPRPSETDPLPVTRMRWPFLTTKPELVQPFAVLSAKTFKDRDIGLAELVSAGACRVVSGVLESDGGVSAFLSVTGCRLGCDTDRS